MLRIVLAVLAAFAVLVGLLLGVAMTRPDTYQVQREVEIGAAPPAVFANLEDFKRWRDWSPWEKLEPGMQRTYAGAEHGVGASYTWQGDKVGSGTMTVTEASAPQRLAIKLAFVKPFEETSLQQFALTPTAAGTRVRWSMHGPLRLGGRVMSLFTDMDKIIGRDFETGLTQLKQLCEKPSAAAP